MSTNPDLKAKTEKLEKLRREKLMRERNKPKDEEDKAASAVKEEQKAIDTLLTRVKTYTKEAEEHDRDEAIKKKLQQRLEASPLKKQLANTVSSFVGEFTIQPKPKFAMYDKLVQAGDDNLSIPVGTDEPVDSPAVASSNPIALRPVRIQCNIYRARCTHQERTRRTTKAEGKRVTSYLRRPKMPKKAQTRTPRSSSCHKPKVVRGILLAAIEGIISDKYSFA